MNSEIPIISIIVPTYNRGHLIEKTILSLLSQTDNRYEIIIVDDGSTDNTESIIASYLSDKLFYYKKENAERAAARNFGTQKARGEYINWFDSDDLAMENHIATAISQIETEGDIAWFHLNYSIIDSSGKIIRKGNSITDLKKSLIKGNVLSCNGVFVKKEIAIKNPFNEDRALSASEDYELWLRLISQFSCKCIDINTSFIVQHDERSVLMSDPQKLITRFEKFIQYITSNDRVAGFLGKFQSYFIMKNYLILAVDLAANGYKKEAFHYLIVSLRYSKKVFLERAFFATIKHIFL